MYGRYGSDGFSFFLLLLALVCTFLGSLFFWPLTLLADAVYIYTVFRMFSRNIPARQREYYAFLKVWGPVKSWFALQKRKFSERKYTRSFSAPSANSSSGRPGAEGK